MRTKDKLERIFTQIHLDNYWRDEESVSGPGSNLEQTEVIRRDLPQFIFDLGITSMLDIPCGDFYWMQLVQLELTNYITGFHYIGADIVESLIQKNQQRFSGYEFQVLDVVTDPLPKVDLVLVRDLFGHLSNYNVARAINNIRSSGSTYFLATNFPDDKWEFSNINDGEWRPINLSRDFGLGEPIGRINEGLTIRDGKFADKELALWRIQDE